MIYYNKKRKMPALAKTDTEEKSGSAVNKNVIEYTYHFYYS